MMGLPSFVRRILSPGRFPQIEGQELPDPVANGPARAAVDQQQVRRDALGGKPSKVPKKPKP